MADDSYVKEWKVLELTDAMIDVVNALEFDPVADATTTTKGKVRLAGDLGGTADAPTVPGLANKADTGHTHTLADITDYEAGSGGGGGSGDSRVIYGNGRPDIPATLTTAGTPALVSAAANGTAFISLDGPQGAWEWRKRGTSWTCVEGDTLSRDVTDLLYNGWTPAAANGRALIRRTGVSITTNFYLSAAASTADAILVLPVGFRETSSTSSRLTFRTGSGTSLALVDGYISAGIYLAASAGKSPQVNLLSGWQTAQPWPVTLPGTSA